MKKIIILICFVALSVPVFIAPQHTHASTLGLGAGNYTPLAPLDGASKSAPIDVSDPKAFANYINLMIKLAIGLAGVLAVVMIIAGGIEYMGSDSVFSKGEGMKKIQNSLLGILLALSCYLILNTINPQLLNISIDLKGKENAAAPEPQEATFGGTTDGVRPSALAGNSYTGGLNKGDTIGQKNNNYGNIKGTGWQGQTGTDEYGHAIFADPTDGTRAYMKNLVNQYDEGANDTHKTNNSYRTIDDLVGYYTAVEGDRNDYANYISRQTGIARNQDLQIVNNGSVNQATLYNMTKAMYVFESKVTVDQTHLNSAYGKLR